MIKNYLTIAFRTLRRHPGYTFINVVGLAVGVACCVLMLRYVRHELSYDRFHENADHIYRVVSEQETNGVVTASARTPVPLAAALQEEMPGVEQAVRLGPAWTGVMSHGDQQFHEEGLYFADPNVFDVFSLNLMQGNPETVLQRPNSILLTEAMARKYFGDENPIGQTLLFTFEGSQEFEVTGVVEALPPNAHFHFDFLAPMASQPRFLEMMAEQWDFNFRPTYVLLSDTDVATIEARLPAFVQQHYPDAMQATTTLSLQPLTDIHLHSRLQGEIEPNGSITALYAFSGIALLILLIACVNFMNLATARSAQRAREVGMRKVLGANRANLIRQFLGEAVLLSSIAVVLALALAQVFLPALNMLTDREMTLFGADGWVMVGALVALALVVGTVAGSYPAFFLSAFRPARVLKGAHHGSQQGVSLRKLLVTAQFVVTIFFLIGIGIMSEQIDYLLARDLGFDEDQIAYIRSPQRTEPMDLTRYQEELTGAGVVQVAGTSDVPGSGHSFFELGMRPMATSNDEQIANAYMLVSPNFFETYNLTWETRPNLSEAALSDTIPDYVLNAAAVRALGWDDAVLDREVGIFFGSNPEPFTRGRVVGVVEDFHFESLHTEIRPLIISVTPSTHTWTYLALRIRPNDLPATLAHIEAAWARLAPEWPLDMAFLDDQASEMYQAEAQLSRIISYATLLAILIACMGLFGLASFTAEQRTKEIGVRKVLGATVGSIVVLLSKDFVKLVLIGFVLAVPLASLATARWLADFAYHIDPGVSVFALSGILALGIALLTVSYQAIRAALADPVKSLRYE